MAADKNYKWGVGRRKTSVARVRVKPGTGQFLINGREMREYFPVVNLQRECFAPIDDAGVTGKFDIFVNVCGGGVSGQAGAVRLGVARALLKIDEGLMPTLRAAGHTTRDSRMKERKKYGLRGARRATQFSKR